MARTISTICRSASEMSSTSASGSMCSMPSRASIASASAPRRRARDQAERAARLAPDQEVFRDRHPRQQRQFLEHRPDAERMAVLRAGQPRWPALDADGAGIGHEPAAERLDQRALAGAVLADQRMHLAARGDEIRRTQRLHAAERLAEAEPRHRRIGGGLLHVHAVGSVTVSLPWHALPFSAASMQNFTIAFGPASVKSGKEAVGHVGKHVLARLHRVVGDEGKRDRHVLLRIACRAGSAARARAR